MMSLKPYSSLTCTFVLFLINCRRTNTYHLEGNVPPPHLLLWHVTDLHHQPPFQLQREPLLHQQQSKTTALLNPDVLMQVLLTFSVLYNFFLCLFLFHLYLQAKPQGTPTLTWCNETTPPIPPADIKTSTYPETSSHPDRSPHPAKEGLQAQGSVSCPGCSFAVPGLQ